MVYWHRFGSITQDTEYRDNFIRIMHGMDSRYLALREEQLAEWLEFPCRVRGYENDHLYAYAGFRNPGDVNVANRMCFAILLRHMGANASDGDAANGAGELLMLGWTGASAEQSVLDAAINALVDKGLEWLDETGLAGQPVRCFRPYKMTNGAIRALHERVFVRTQMNPPDRIEMQKRVVLEDGECWKLVPLN